MPQPVLAGKEEISRLNFVDVNGNPMPAPAGVVNSSLQSMLPPFVSGDYQSVHFTPPATAGVTFTLTWKDSRGPDAGVPDFSATFVTRSIIGSFGQPSPA